MNKQLKVKLKVRNKLLVKLLTISIISILLGLFYTAIISKTDKNTISDSLKSFFNNLDKLNYNKAFINCLISNSLYIIIIFILGISILGIPIILIILTIKSFLLGFSISSILYFYKFKGILIALIYVIPLIINLFSIIYLSYYSICFSKNLINLLFFNKKVYFRDIMKRYLKILIILIVICVFSSIIEIYVIPELLKLLQI